eukprot:1943427-Rhodomonas_salina.1
MFYSSHRSRSLRASPLPLASLRLSSSWGDLNVGIDTEPQWTVTATRPGTPRMMARAATQPE